MGRPLTAAAIRKMLEEGLDRYREQHERGEDMAKAGEELAGIVEKVVSGPVCGMPRSYYLRQRNDEGG